MQSKSPMVTAIALSVFFSFGAALAAEKAPTKEAAKDTVKAPAAAAKNLCHD